MSIKNNNLPIGLDTETILKKWMKLIENIPKIYRYTIIPEILKTLSYMISDIFFANAIKEERKYHLTNYIARLQSIKSLTRVLHETKALDHRKANILFLMYENVSQQAVKWKNYSKDNKSEL